ncbi:MAG TPA: Ig-like domain-containing protein [Longimicrobiaceae bacterium]|nr:Ig-like domain-containing protein [Longimicrobiaceae bacterium]
MNPRRAGGLVLAVLALAACSDRSGPVAPVVEAPREPVQVARIECTANVQSHSVSCANAGLSGPNALILGGQGVFVQIATANAAYDGVAVYAFDLTVQNLVPSPQVLATTDGVTPTAEGVRVIFHQAPTVTGGFGAIAVTNADGQGTFTGANQDYFQYSGALLGGDGILTSNEITSSKNWQFAVAPTVTTFSWVLFVVADVRYPDGWIDVSPAVDSIVAGGTQALTGTVRTAVGTVMTGQTITWGTTDAAVGTVDGSGLATGVAPGSVTFTATSGPRSGASAFCVAPDLAVGDVYTAVMPAAADLCFAGGASGDAEYTYMPINFSTSSALSLTLTGTGIIAVTGPPTPDLVAPPGPRLALQPVRNDDWHVEMMERDRRELAAFAGRPETRVNRAVRREGGPRMLITPGVPTIGDLWQLNVASGCPGARDDRTGRVVSIGAHVIIVSDTMNPPGGFTTAQYDSIALEYDTLVHEVDTTAFGGPTDLDTNQRAVVFYTRAVNELSPPASSVVVLGFFTARDLFSSAPASCPRSNEGEMFYMLVPDPTGAVNSNVRTVSFVRGSTVGTMAHEFQHLINASRRIYLVPPTWNGLLEEVWLNEGLSHIAEELVFYRASVGLAPRGNIVVTQLTTGPNASRRVAAFNTYANQNFGRFRSWLQRPDTSGALKNVDALASRGATWSFLRYAADRLGGTESDTWFGLVNTQLTGTANLEDVFGVDIEPWVRDWIAAMYADDAVAGVAAQYTNLSWNYRSLYIALNTSYQLVPRPLTNGVGLTLSYSRGGATAYARFGVPTGAFAGMTALSGGVPPVSPYALIVVRSK